MSIISIYLTWLLMAVMVYGVFETTQFNFSWFWVAGSSCAFLTWGVL